MLSGLFFFFFFFLWRRWVSRLSTVSSHLRAPRKSRCSALVHLNLWLHRVVTLQADPNRLAYSDLTNIPTCQAGKGGVLS